MPVKKTTTKETKAPKAKTTAKKAVVKKEAKPAAVKKETVKKTVAKKETVKKATTKKSTTKKVAKQKVDKYIDVINWKKGEANGSGWLYIEVNAQDLNNEVEYEVENIKTACEAIKECMLEGDEFLVAPKKADASLTVRYYTDNLSDERKKYSE